MADRRIVGYNATDKRLEVNSAGNRYLAEMPLHITQAFTTDSTVDGRDVAVDGSKLDLINVTTSADLDTMVTMLNHITVTQTVNLDTMEARVNALDASVVLMGSWNPNTGTFPTSTKAGESWVCSGTAVVSAIQFRDGDRILALVDGASPSTYAGNWLILDYTDQVSSVAGRIGAVTLTEADITDLQSYTLPADFDSLAKLNALCGETLIITTDSRLTDNRPPTYPVTTGLTAYATGGQANATQLVAHINVVTTCATAGDSVKLPAAAAELPVICHNRGAEYLHLYPNTGDEIETEGVNNPIVINPFGTVHLVAIDATTWIMI